MNCDKKKWKTNEGDILEIQLLFEWRGWRINHISRKLKLHQSTIMYHIESHGFKRKVPVMEGRPEEIKLTYKVREPVRFYEKLKKRQQESVKRDCQHKFWIKRCSVCGKILGSDATEEHPGLVRVGPTIDMRADGDILKTLVN